jgi:tetraacyldisaccharide 4'-kinase
MECRPGFRILLIFINLLGKKNILLYPFSVIFGIITLVRNLMYNTGFLHSHEFNLPVICIGNITIGGTGKTPHCEYLVDLLKEKFKVVVLSRGYMRKSRGFLIATPGVNQSDLGDEPLQIFRKHPDVTVAVDADRVRGIRSILDQRPETEVIILDDGFQHRRLKPGFSILLTDFNRLMLYDHLLPYGELRERLNNMYRANIILVTKCPPDLPPIKRRLIAMEFNKAPYQNIYFTTFEYRPPIKVFPDNEVIQNNIFPSASRGKTGIVLVTGIANPTPFKDYLQNLCCEIVHFAFPDHHRFSQNDILKIEDAYYTLKSDVKYIITTEKDAVRLREFTNITVQCKRSFYYFPIGVSFLNDDTEEFNNLILEYVRENKRDNRISESKRI